MVKVFEGDPQTFLLLSGDRVVHGVPERILLGLAPPEFSID